jgi:general stress protein 26
MDITKQIHTFLNDHKLCVIATVSAENAPEAATVGFGQTADLEIIFGTDKDTRKYRNLMHDQHVAFVIGGEHGETVQYEGIAREINQHEMHLVDDNYLKKSPESAKFRNNPHNRYFIVKPKWIRYTNIHQTPWHVEELTF